ncbi:hypothetical protein Misp06_03769 [Microbulbifer sp. NBRC 101763]|uniref:hypothetical protein n=1 Tax=Microbulbifer TaxID=48073 RepID=UPI0012F8B3A6|nr:MULTISPECIES: hypothetical protein [Microbulbifer]WHI50400.1 hypothetical protein P3339_18445 [Microbulbifer sp. MLAF003]
MKKTVIGLSFLAISSPSLASVAMPSYQIPETVGVLPDGRLEINFPQAFNSACTDGSGKRIYIEVGNSQGVTHESIKQIQSVVLAAHAARIPIKFWYDRPNNGAICEGGKVVMAS